MKCLACESSNVTLRDTKITDFLSERVFGVTDGTIIPVKICYCKDCGFTWYDKRFTQEEEQKIYSGYRSEEYQEMREKYEPNYTKEFNYLLGHDDIDLDSKDRLLTDILKKYSVNPIYNALDYGGDLGQRFPKNYPIDNKFVYDISGVTPLDGIAKLSSYDDCKKIDWDFIMCNHTLEHIGDLDLFIEQVKALGNKNTLFYFEVPFDNPYYPYYSNMNYINKVRLALCKLKIYIYIYIYIH